MQVETLITTVGSMVGTGGLIIGIQSWFKFRENQKQGEMTEKDTITLMRDIHESQLIHYKDHLDTIMKEFDIMKFELAALRAENADLKAQNTILIEKLKILEFKLASK